MVINNEAEIAVEVLKNEKAPPHVKAEARQTLWAWGVQENIINSHNVRGFRYLMKTPVAFAAFFEAQLTSD